MTVYFIGAGPGAADLITVRGARTLAACQVCLYAGSLVPRELLAECPPDARLVDTAQLNLDEITAELVRAHEDGHDVARLHSGDPSVFSAVAEQMRRLDAAGVPYEVVPGVPAFAAAAAALKRELTVPTVGQTVILTRDRPAAPPPCRTARTWRRSGAAVRCSCCTWPPGTWTGSSRSCCRTTGPTARPPSWPWPPAPTS